MREGGFVVLTSVLRFVLPGFLFAAIVSCLPRVVLADTVTDVELPEVLSRKFSIAERFPGPDGLTGLVLEDEGGRKAVAWATGSGRYVIIGEIVSPDGKGLTRLAMDERGLSSPLPQEEIARFREDLEAAALHPVSPEVLYAQARALAGRIPLFDGVDETSDALPILVFFDPSCPHCGALREAFLEMREVFVGRGRQVWFIPVWLLKPESLGLGAGMLATGRVGPEGGGDPAESVDAGHLRMVLDNTVVFARSRVRPPVVPLVLWRNSPDGAVQMKSGEMDRGMLLALAESRLEVKSR